MLIRSIFLSTVFFIYTPFVWAQDKNYQRIDQPPQLLFNALKEERFFKAYKKVFDAYLGLKWVATASGPTSSAEKRNLKNGDVAYLYSTCRPHACETEYLYFLYSPVQGRGWGVINIKSSTDDLPWIDPEIDSILSIARDVKK